MAQFDLRLAIDFHEHPKTKKLRRRMGAEGVIALQILWSFASINHPTGFLPLDAESIADAARWEGNPEEFIEVLANATKLKSNGFGFLEIQPSGYKLHDWEDHQPWIATAPDRSARARRAAYIKHHGREQSSGVDAGSMPDACGERCPSPSPSPSPIPNQEEDARASEGAGVPSPSPPADTDETGVPTSGSPANGGEGVPSSLPGPVPSGQDADPAFAEIEHAYFDLTGRQCSPLDWQDVSATLRDAQGDVEIIVRVMRRVAAGYKPKREGDRIRTFGYFREAILDELARRRATRTGSREDPVPVAVLMQRNDVSELFRRARGDKY